MTLPQIGITQRVERVPAYGERRDCLDQAWGNLLSQLGMLPVPLSNALNDPGTVVDALELSGVILSGGNDIATQPDAINPAPERDALEAKLIDACFTRGIPVLGICRGMQMLNLHLGGKLTATGGHSGERHLIKRTHADAPWEAEFEVNSFHNFAVGANDLAPDLEPMAIAHDETVEACRHKQYACIDIMWHPEREAPATERDIKLLSDSFLRTAD